MDESDGGGRERRKIGREKSRNVQTPFPSPLFMYFPSTPVIFTPVLSRSLRTGVYGPHVFTSLALHHAAPLEGTRAPLFHLHHLCVMLPPAAHQVTPVQTYARPVALSPSRADDACVRE